MMTDISARTEVLAVTAGTPIDILGFEACMFSFAGAGVGGATFTVKHGDDAAALEEADPHCLVVEQTASNAEVKRLGYIGARRYVDVKCSVSSAAGTAVLQRPDAYPQTVEKE